MPTTASNPLPDGNQKQHTTTNANANAIGTDTDIGHNRHTIQQQQQHQQQTRGSSSLSLSLSSSTITSVSRNYNHYQSQTSTTSTGTGSASTATATASSTMELASHGHVYNTHVHGGPRQAQHNVMQQERTAGNTGSGMAMAVDDAASVAASNPLLYSSNANANANHFHLPQHQVNNEQQSINNNNNNNNNQLRPPTQRSPNVFSRSSPIAIIHNPEDGADQAKLRWQHPMYDTSDDEMDDDDFFQSTGVSVHSLTSPPELARGALPKSLPNSLLRAPKLGSLPSGQDYRLHHLATLPPPMCLNGAMETETSTTTQICGPPPQQTTGTHNTTGSYAGKPKYLSSYGSLRESHLTGRFGAQSQPQIYNNNFRQGPDSQPVVRYDPPATLIPPRQPPSNNLIPPRHPPTTLIAPRNSVTNSTSDEPPQQQQQQQQPPEPQSQTTSPITSNPSAKPLSIRDRMMQKAQQKEKSDQEAATKKAASSLSAMLEASDKDSMQTTPDTKIASQQGVMETTGKNNASGIFHLGPSAAPAIHRSSLGPGVLPAGISQAVAISYNSNMNLFSRNNQQQQQSPPQESSAMLSSSMTGLEILRAASKSRPARPTSLSILQDAPRGSMILPPPAALTHSTATDVSQSFQPMARTMSEPGPHAFEEQNLRQSTSASSTPPQVHSSVSHEVSTGYTSSLQHPGILRTSDGRSLIPPRQMGPMIAAEEQTYSQRSYPQPQTGGTTSPSNLQYSLNAWDASMQDRPTVMTSAFGVGVAPHAYQGTPPPFGTQPGEENPDTEEAFDMDLE